MRFFYGLKIRLTALIIACLWGHVGYADVITRPAWSYSQTMPQKSVDQIPLPSVRPNHFPSRSLRTSFANLPSASSVPLPPQRPSTFASLAPSPQSQFQPHVTNYVRPIDTVSMAERMAIPHPHPVITHTALVPKTLINYATKAADEEEDELGYLGEDHRIMHIPSLRKGFVPGSSRVTLMGARPDWYPLNESVVTACFPPLLRSALQQLADYFHRDVIITSGYRDHGRAHSLHRTCQAADIMVDGITPVRLAHVASTISGVNGVGTYRHVRITHIDVRDYKAAWRY